VEGKGGEVNFWENTFNKDGTGDFRRGPKGDADEAARKVGKGR